MTTPSYQDPQSIVTPATGGAPSSSWANAVRNSLQFVHAAPGAVAQLTSAQTGAASETYTPVTFSNSTLRDTDSMWATTKITSKFDGWYMCCGIGNFSLSDGTKHIIALRVNGVDYYQNDYAAGLGARMNIAFPIYLAANSYVELCFYHNYASALVIAAGARLSVIWAGA